MPLIPKQEPPYYENGTAITTKYYEAIIQQTGTSAPTTTELKNTIGNIIWTRSATGSYTGTLTAAFPENKRMLNTHVDSFESSSLIAYAGFSSEDTIEILTYSDYTWISAADLEGTLYITITIYP